MNWKAALSGIAVVAVSYCGSAYAVFFDGNKLNGERAGYLAVQRGKPGTTDYQGSSLYYGYVAGISDTVTGFLVCEPSNVTVGQEAAIVSKYMDENPDKWALPASQIVINALSTAFPCPSKQ
jgi:hypothetical protein